VRLQYVKGHSGEEGNEGADGLAGQGCMLKSLSERDWAAEEGTVRADIKNKNVTRIQDTEVLEAAVPATTAAPDVVVVDPKDVDFEVSL
jgi:hypothetical protein